MVMNGLGELESVAGWGDPRTVICLELKTKISQSRSLLGTSPS